MLLAAGAFVLASGVSVLRDALGLERVPRSFVVLALLAAAGLVVVFTVIGLVVLWPRGDLDLGAAPFGAIKTERARVTDVQERPCRQTGLPGQQRTCARVIVRARERAERAVRAELRTGDASLQIALDRRGDRIRVFENRVPDDAPIGGVPARPLCARGLRPARNAARARARFRSPRRRHRPPRGACARSIGLGAQPRRW